MENINHRFLKLEIDHDFHQLLARSFIKKKEDLIISAIEDHTGEKFSIESFKERISSIVNPAGIETYYVDGKPLIEIFPYESSINEANIELRSNYRILN